MWRHEPSQARFAVLIGARRRFSLIVCETADRQHFNVARIGPGEGARTVYTREPCRPSMAFRFIHAQRHRPRPRSAAVQNGMTRNTKEENHPGGVGCDSGTFHSSFRKGIPLIGGNAASQLSLLSRRLERAERKLRETQLPLSEIAVATGFSDQSHLARHFRRRTGCRPGWRARRSVSSVAPTARSHK
jgi:hypothetical protein